MSYIVKRGTLRNGKKQFGTGLGDRIIVGNNVFRNDFVPLDALDPRKDAHIRAVGDNPAYTGGSAGGPSYKKWIAGSTDIAPGDIGREDCDVVKPMMLASSVMGGPRLNKDEGNANSYYGQYGNPKGAPYVLTVDDSGDAGDWLAEGTKLFMSWEGLLYEILSDGKIQPKKWDKTKLDNACYYVNYSSCRLNNTPEDMEMQLGNSAWSELDGMYNMLYYAYNGTANDTATTRFTARNRAILQSSLIGQDEKFIYYEQIFGGGDYPSYTDHMDGAMSYSISSYYPMAYKILVAVRKSDGKSHWLNQSRYSTDGLNNYYMQQYHQGSRAYEKAVKKIAVSGQAYTDNTGASQTASGGEVMYESDGGGGWQPIMVNRVFIYCKNNAYHGFWMLDPQLNSLDEPATLGPKMNLIYSTSDSYNNHITPSEIITSVEDPDNYKIYVPYGSAQQISCITFAARSDVNTNISNTSVNFGAIPSRYGSANSTSMTNWTAYGYHDSRNCLIIEEGGVPYLIFFTAGIRHIDYQVSVQFSTQSTGESATYGAFLCWKLDAADDHQLEYKSDIADWSYRKRFAGFVCTEDNKRMAFFNQTGVHLLQWNAPAEEVTALDPISMEFVMGLAMEPSSTNAILWIEQLNPRDTTSDSTKQQTCMDSTSDIFQLQFGDYKDVDLKYEVDGIEYTEFTSKTLPTEQDGNGDYIAKTLTVKSRVKSSTTGVADAFEAGVAYQLRVSGGNKETDGLYWTGADVADDYAITTTSTEDWQTWTLNYREPLAKIIITAKLQ